MSGVADERGDYLGLSCLPEFLHVAALKRLFAAPLVRSMLPIRTRDLRVHRAPGIPPALRAGEFASLGRGAPRDRAAAFVNRPRGIATLRCDRNLVQNGCWELHADALASRGPRLMAVFAVRPAHQIILSAEA